MKMKLKRTADDFRDSIETRQRFTREIKAYDNNEVRLLLERLHYTISAVNEFYNATKSSLDLAKAFGVRDILMHGLNVTEEEYGTWIDAYKIQWHSTINEFEKDGYGSLIYLLGLLIPRFLLITGIQGLDDYWPFYMPDLNPALIDYLKSNTIVDSVHQCLENNITEDEVYKDELFNFFLYSEYTNPPLTNVTLCLYALQLKRHIIHQGIFSPSSIADRLTHKASRAISLYESAVHAILNNTGFQAMDFPEYGQCVLGFSEISNVTNTIKMLLQHIDGLIGTTNTHDEYMKRAERLTVLFEFETVKNAPMIILKHLNNSICRWPTSYYVDVGRERESALSYMSNAINHHKEAVENYHEASKLLHDYFSNQDRYIAPAVAELSSYLRGNISQLDLADYFLVETGNLFFPKVENYADVHQWFVSANFSVSNATTMYKNAYRKMWNILIPIYNHTQLWNSPLWKQMLEPSQNSALQSLMHNVTEQMPFPVHFDDMFDILFGPYLFYFGEKNDAVYNTTTEFIQAFKMYYKYLENFRSQMEIDNDFYL